jgi:hypothetical protein
MRAGWLKILCGFIVIIMSISTYSSVFGPVEGKEPIDQFMTGSSYTVTFPDGGGSENKSRLKIPTDSTVQSATMRVIAEPNAGQYPIHVSLDVGENGVLEWEFDEIGGGSMGWQNSLWTGVNNTPFDMGVGDSRWNTTAAFRLPQGVTIDSASMEIWAEEQDFLGTLQEMNMPGGGLEGPWDDVHDFDPMLINYQGKLIDIYRTHSDEISNGTDGDLVLNWTTDGVTWNNVNEITKVPDTSWPWNNIRRYWWGMDMRPTAAVYDDGTGNRLYVAWEGNSTFEDMPPDPPITPEDGDDAGVTSGIDKDIIISSSSDGITWSNQMSDYVQITSKVLEDGNSTPTSKGYNKANPAPQDWFPQLATFNGRLYCAWVSNNTDSPADMHGGSDIMVTWSTNPRTEAGWNDTSRVVNINEGDQWNGSDFNPKLVVFNNKLFVVWMTNDTTRGNGSDYDILIKYTDGTIWSETFQVSPKGMNDFTEEGVKGTIKNLSWYDRFQHPYVFDNKLWIAWETENYRYGLNRTWNKLPDTETDADIVIACSSDGISWDLQKDVNIFEVTPPSNDWGDHYPHLITLDPDAGGSQPERLYCGWNSNDQGVTINDYDIMYSYTTDGKNWVPQRIANPHPDHGGGDYWTHFGTFNDWLYITWWSNDDKDGDIGGMYADGDDADVVVRRIVPSYLPAPMVTVDVGDDNSNEFGPLSLDRTKKTIDIKTALQSGLNNPTTLHNDIYGNSYVDVIINVTSPSVPCRIWISNISIYYSRGGGNFYMDVPDFSKALNEYIRVNQDDEDADDGYFEIPVEISTTSGGKLTMTNVNIEYNRKPTITVTSPGDSIGYAKDTFTITWTDEDPDDNAQIKLFYDIDNVPGGETEIDTTANPIMEDDADDFYIWDTTNLSLGSSLFIKAVIDDGIDSAYSYSRNIVTVTKDNVPPSITIVRPSVSNDKTEFDYWIEWIDSDEDSNAWISLYYDTNKNPNDGKILISDGIRENDEKDKYHWLIGDEVGLGNYYVYAEITDEENTTNDYSDGYIELIPPSLNSPVNLGIKNNMDTTGIKLETHDILPELTWENSPLNPLPNSTNLIEYEYMVTVGTSKTLKDDLLKNWETKSRSVKLANDLTYGEDYYFEVKVTDGRGHYSPGASSIFFIVNNPPTTPTVEIHPANPITTDPLTVKISEDSTDPDGDEVKYKYKWLKNNLPQTAYDGLMLVSFEDTTKGDQWTVEVTPWDEVGGILRSPGTKADTVVVIKNAPPKPKIIAPLNNTEFEEGDEIKFIGEGNDADNDPDKVALDQLNFEWSSDLDSKIIGLESTVKTTSLSPGFHVITLNVSDDEDYGTQTVWIEITPKKGDGGKTTEEDDYSTMTFAAAGIAVIVVVLMLIFVFFFLMKRKKKEEPMYPELDAAVEEPTGPSAEELYGTDLPSVEGEPKPEMGPPEGETTGPEAQMPPAGPPAEEGPPKMLEPGAEAGETPETPPAEEQKE